MDEPLLAALAHDRVCCVSAYSEEHAIVGGDPSRPRRTDAPPVTGPARLTERLRQPETPPVPRLTPREEQVLELAATGLTVSQIATSLHISHSTAKTHPLRVYEKLGAPNRSAAVAIALAHGMLRGGAIAA
jgi:DNA-binding CsgD family transcriptional regulator